MEGSEGEAMGRADGRSFLKIFNSQGEREIRARGSRRTGRRKSSSLGNREGREEGVESNQLGDEVRS